MKARTSRHQLTRHSLFLAEADLARLFTENGLPFSERGQVTVGVWEPGIELQEKFSFLTRGSCLVLSQVTTEIEKEERA